MPRQFLSVKIREFLKEMAFDLFRALSGSNEAMSQIMWYKSMSRKLNAAGVNRSEEAEAEKGAKGGGKSSEGKGSCRFFLTDEGCRKGKECTFNHVLDKERRCWNCGSKAHFSNSCTRPKEGEKGGGKSVRTMQKTPEKEGKGSSGGGSQDGKKDDDVEARSTCSAASGASGGSGDIMQQLLEEANKMLKSMNVKTEEPRRKVDEEEDRFAKLQRQLEEIKRLKVFRLSRMERKDDRGWGLLDSGATHPLRPLKKEEVPERMPLVKVTLAGGQDVQMRLSEGGSIVSEDNVEPIVPLGLLTRLLQCSVRWEEGGMKVIHPLKGKLEVKLEEGCPLVPRRLAMELIEEIEERSDRKSVV